MTDVCLKVGELFCGAGGFALGASLVRYRGWRFHHVWASDNSRDACETFRSNIPADHVICQDVEHLNFRKLEAIDGLLFGFPCNDFSIVGERKGLTGKYGKLYSYGVKALGHFQPSFFVAENVGGIQSVNNSLALPLIHNSFEKMGYDVFTNLYKFEDYAVPQRRWRVLFIGFKRELVARFSPPKPSPARMTVREALSNIPIDANNHEYTKQHPRVVERLKYIKAGENAFTAELPELLRLKRT